MAGYETMNQQSTRSRQYKIFMEEERWAGLPGSIYEKACNFAEKILNVEPDKETKEKLEEAISFANLKITPEGVASLTILIILSVVFPMFILLITNLFGLPGLSLMGALLIIVLTVPFAYFMYIYPLHLRKRFEIKTGSDVVTLILYMAVYMRNNPNMEGALRFTADNMRGALAYELRKLLWDIEVGKYRNVDEALIQYAKKWKEEKEFIESIQLLRNSLKQTEERRIQMLQESVDLILNSTMEKANQYNRKLKMPILIIHAMGVILPVMGLVLFPVIAVFLDIKPIALFLGYDIILPIILFFVIFNTLETRPPTFSTIDVQDHPDAPPEGEFYLGENKKSVPVFPISAVPAAVLIVLGIFMMLTDPAGEGLLGSLIITIGLAIGPMIYFLLNSQQNLKIRKSVRNTENQFREALFQLGNQVSIGNPMEIAMEKAIGKIGDLDIKELFKRAAQNIRNNGMTFKQAFFNKKYGALRYFPSKMIESIMRTVIEASRRGMNTASIAMLTISNFLKRIRKTQEKVEDSLSDVTTSLQFQAYFLSPLVSGMIVTMALVIISILKKIGPQIEEAGIGGTSPMGFAQSLWSNIPITTGVFQLIVGIYMVETCIILGYFVNGIQNGEDNIGMQDIVGSSLLFGTIIYVVTFAITYFIFGGLIQGVLA